MYYFLVYNDNTHTTYLRKLIRSVEKYGPEFRIIIFNKRDMDKEFVEKNKDILNCNRGGGYWLWKPYIINEVLKKINHGDIVFYLDSKYYFIDSLSKLYSDYMTNNDILVWKHKPNSCSLHMKYLCKMDVIVKYNMVDKVFRENVDECWAGAIIVKKTDNTLMYIQEWLDMCCNYEDITDSKSKIKNSHFFKEHRHDQSLLSIVIYKYNIELQILGRTSLQDVRNPF
jgi:hypothetical protein